MAGLSVALVMRNGIDLGQDFRCERKLATVGERLSSLRQEEAQRYGSDSDIGNKYARRTKHGSQDSLESLTVSSKRIPSLLERTKVQGVRRARRL